MSRSTGWANGRSERSGRETGSVSALPFMTSFLVREHLGPLSRTRGPDTNYLRFGPSGSVRGCAGVQR